MTDRPETCPLCGEPISTITQACSVCLFPPNVWPAVAALKARIAGLEVVLGTMMDNCGCCEDVGPCANCLRAEMALTPKAVQPPDAGEKIE